VPFFSSQEWTQTIVDTNTKYIGRWGLTVHSFNPETRRRVSPNKLYMYVYRRPDQICLAVHVHAVPRGLLPDRRRLHGRRGLRQLRAPQQAGHFLRCRGRHLRQQVSARQLNDVANTRKRRLTLLHFNPSPCSPSGHCGDTHCYCNRYYSGPFCTISSAPGKKGSTTSAAPASPRSEHGAAAALSLASAALVVAVLL
jgi:hypothetical protein